MANNSSIDLSVDYKNGFVLLPGSDEYYFSTMEEAQAAFDAVLNGINEGKTAVAIPGKNRMLFIKDVWRLTITSSAQYIREQYERWTSDEMKASAGTSWVANREIDDKCAYYFRLMVAIGELPSGDKGGQE